ncbi:DUF6327 family protein [Mesonia aestuariivivens]|uniref:Glutaminyl-tRNA synthetase n=1 Tax=Mesonia aestuariivivens TaxID=2796128 RepID=A0ABS6W120_9FLAO|nr:DUF6327 family protein [Mesonia aestuariivivens]MBW2961555.1 hypothetical protein [Mesonia aestuariivivens]
MKIYESYQEINHDLKILKLQNHIDRERIKLTVNDIKEDFSPVSVATGIAGKIAKKALILKVVSKLIGIQKAKIVNK